MRPRTYLFVERGRERGLAHERRLLVLEARVLVQARPAEEVTSHPSTVPPVLLVACAAVERGSERASRAGEPLRLASTTFSTRAHSPLAPQMASWGSPTSDTVPPAYARQSSWSAAEWNGSDAAAAAPPPAASPLDGYALPTDHAHDADAARTRPRAGTRTSGFAATAEEDEVQADWALPPLERVQVALKGDMQGWAFVKHHVWTIIHPEKSTSVDRRYSDFVDLLDILTKRYPFRLLPALPPKRIQVSGHYLATDDLFLDRRRRGLERALTALLAHPVLKRDALLNAFISDDRVGFLWDKEKALADLADARRTFPSTARQTRSRSQKSPRRAPSLQPNSPRSLRTSTRA